MNNQEKNINGTKLTLVKAVSQFHDAVAIKKRLQKEGRKAKIFGILSTPNGTIPTLTVYAN